MSRDLPGYDRWALDSGADHQCRWLRVVCPRCEERSTLRREDGPDAYFGTFCDRCDRPFTPEDTDAGECGCDGMEWPDDDERKERR